MIKKNDIVEHPKGSGIRIREKINTSGTEVYGSSFAVTVPVKVTGGARIRKQYKTLKEAKEYAELQYKGKEAEGLDFFKATDEERNQFANLVPRLREAGISLQEAVDFALPRLRPVGGDRTMTEICMEIRKSKLARMNSGAIRDHSERTFRVFSQRVIEEFGGIKVRDLTLEEVRNWLETTDVAPRTKRNYLNGLSEILRYSVARQYTTDSILNRLTKSDRQEIYGNDEQKEPETLTPLEAERLINAALEHPELDLLGAVTLGLFCGIRTEELQKLEWKDIRIEEGFVNISGKIAKKRRIRNVTLSPAAITWLSCCKNKSGKLTRIKYLSDYHKRFNRLLKHAKFTEEYEDEKGRLKERVIWKKNAMRHSFGTYHFALHQDSIKTSNELGHKQGDNVLFEHYRALATEKQAQAYFAIVPPANANKVVKFAS